MMRSHVAKSTALLAPLFLVGLIICPDVIAAIFQRDSTVHFKVAPAHRVLALNGGKMIYYSCSFRVSLHTGFHVK